MTGTLKVRHPSGSWTPVAGNGQEAASVASWNSAWGAVGFTSFSGALSVPVNETTGVNIGTVSWTAVAGRRYRAVMYLSAVAAAGVRGAAQGAIDGVVPGALGGPWVASPVAPNEFSEQGLEWDLSKVAIVPGARTFSALLLNKVSGTIYRDALYIEDMGPLVPVSVAPPEAGPRVVASGNALGIVAMGRTKGQQGFALAANTALEVADPITFYAAAGRRYRIFGTIRAVAPQSTGADGYLRFTSVSGAITNNDTHSFISNAYDAPSATLILNGTGNYETVGLTWFCSAATSVYSEQMVSQFYVEDVGPNTYPALPIPETPPAWTPLPLESGWTPYNATTHQTPQYRKVGDVVTLRGQVAGPGVGYIAYMPVGFAPPKSVYVTTRGSGTATSNAIDIYGSNRGVYLSALGAGAAASFVVLDGISFSTTT